MDARLRTIERLDEIEVEFASLYRDYEVLPRCSREHTMAWTAISNRESERSMLEAALGY